MNLVKITKIFDKWLKGLKDRTGKARVLVALKRLEPGQSGDWKSLGNGLAELRIHYGAGYRIYYCRKGDVVIILLSGGDKSSQKRDIEKTKILLKELEA